MYRNENAFPFVNRLASTYEDADNKYGFSKIELAALMIAPALIAKCAPHEIDHQRIARVAAAIAVAVLEAAVQFETLKPDEP